MKKNVLGRTGIEVSELSFGAVCIGLPYGIEAGSQRPDDDYFVSLLNTSLEKGFNFFDTARGYGKSEELIGKAFEDKRQDVVICTKPAHIKPGQLNSLSYSDIHGIISDSLQTSLQNLKTDYVDVLMAHNGLLEYQRNKSFVKSFGDMKQKGLTKSLGVSVYSVEESLEAINSGVWDVIQLPFNLMDQQQQEVFELAHEKGVGIVVRSVLFKGILADNRRALHPALKAIDEHCELYRELLDDDTKTLSELATKFVLSQKGISSVLVGIDKFEYLDQALKVTGGKCLSETVLSQAKKMSYPDPEFLDLQKWSREGWLI
ncbi:MAG: aldo/keto reductase [Sedimentisphaeraceae bacterium JB056]